MKPRLVMFDMDGVLFDTMPLHVRAWRRTMAEFGYDLPDTVPYEHEGRTAESTVMEIAGPCLDWRAVYRRKCELFDEQSLAPVMQGALEAVRAARALGADAIVVTGSGQATTLARLEAEFTGLFHTPWMVTGRDVVHGKPDPEPYLRGLSNAGVPAAEAVVVENAPLGVRAGKAAGCRVLAVNTGPLPDEMLLREGADLIFPSMAALAEFFRTPDSL